MNTTRRQLLRLGLVSAAAAGPLAVAERALAAFLPARLARATFTPLVGSTFQMVTPGQSYRAVLASVGDLANSPAGDPHRFQLMFTVADGGPGQGTYTFRNRALGSVALFVVPVGGGRQHYEAIVVS